MNIALTTAIGLALALPTPAQLPPAHGARFSAAYTPPGIEFLDLSVGPAYQVQNAHGVHFGAATLDPVSLDFIVAGYGDNKHKLIQIGISGAAMTGETLLAATATPSEAIRAVAIGPNGDYYLADRGQLYVVDRETHALIPWDASFAATYGEATSLFINREKGRLYLGTSGASSAILEYDLAAGPGPGQLLFDASGSAFGKDITGIGVDFYGGLLVSTGKWGTLGETLYLVDSQTGVPSAIPGVPIMGPETRAVTFDRTTGLVHYLMNNWWRAIDPITGVDIVLDNSLSGSGPFGKPQATALAINDLMHRTEVFPREGSNANGFLLEVTAHGNPGDLAGVGVSAINGVALSPPLILGGIGVATPGGHYPQQLSIPAGLLPIGTNVELTSGTMDPKTGILSMGFTANVVIVP